jgi:chromosome partitioning protein
MAATEVLCPVALQGPSLDGLKTFFQYLQSAQKLNRELRLKYVLPTMFDRRTRQSHEILQQLQKYFSRQLCQPIHSNVRLSEAPSHGKTIFEYHRRATGARDYSNLIRRVMTDGGLQKNNAGVF